jgi:hypothetical protein
MYRYQCCEYGDWKEVDGVNGYMGLEIPKWVKIVVRTENEFSMMISF